MEAIMATEASFFIALQAFIGAVCCGILILFVVVAVMAFWEEIKAPFVLLKRWNKQRKSWWIVG